MNWILVTAGLRAAHSVNIAIVQMHCLIIFNVWIEAVGYVFNIFTNPRPGSIYLATRKTLEFWFVTIYNARKHSLYLYYWRCNAKFCLDRALLHKFSTIRLHKLQVFLVSTLRIFCQMWTRFVLCFVVISSALKIQGIYLVIYPG